MCFLQTVRVSQTGNQKRKVLWMPLFRRCNIWEVRCCSQCDTCPVCCTNLFVWVTDRRVPPRALIQCSLGFERSLNVTKLTKATLSTEGNMSSQQQRCSCSCRPRPQCDTGWPYHVWSLFSLTICRQTISHAEHSSCLKPPCAIDGNSCGDPTPKFCA